MPNQNISALTSGNPAVSADQIPINRTGTNFSITAGSIAALAPQGTVTNTGGNLTANAVVLGAGGADTKVSTGITTNGVAELDIGVAGTSGVLGLKGTTSGTATYTVPAVAGTITNPRTPYLLGCRRCYRPD